MGTLPVRNENFSYESLDARSRNPFGSRVFHHRRSPIHPCWGEKARLVDGGAPARARSMDGPGRSLLLLVLDFFLLVARGRPRGESGGRARTPAQRQRLPREGVPGSRAERHKPSSARWLPTRPVL